MKNLLLDTDSYKYSHYLQMPQGTDSMFSYIESRGGEYESTLFFGLQYYLKEYLSKGVTKQDVEEAAEMALAHGVPFNREGWMYVVNECGGKLPVRIRAVAEGTVVPVGNALVTIESTDPKAFWVVSWLETMLLRVWYPITVATQSYHIKKLIREFLIETSGTDDGLLFKLHDFGARGVSSQESAMIGGASHLVNFLGTDTIAGMVMAHKYYGGSDKGVGGYGFSIPASEHSTITSWGRDCEADAYANMIEQFSKPGSIFAVVSDSYDLQNACANLWGGVLKEKLLASGGLLVVRPDSGDPAQTVLATVKTLESKFGSTKNQRGYKVLQGIRVIQGDGINMHSIREICETLIRNGYCVSNLAFGMGGALLQAVNRDTQRFAMKCSSVNVNGVERDVYKDPVGDPGKRSKKGRLDLISSKDGGYTTVRIDGGALCHPDSVLQTVFEDGEVMSTQNFEDVRKRAAI